MGKWAVVQGDWLHSCTGIDQFLPRAVEVFGTEDEAVQALEGNDAEWYVVPVIERDETEACIENAVKEFLNRG